MAVEKWHQGDLPETLSGKLTLDDIWRDNSDAVTLEIATKGEKAKRGRKDKNAKRQGRNLERQRKAKEQKGKQVQKDNDIGLQCTGRLTVRRSHLRSSFWDLQHGIPVVCKV
ncbi:uncharacterized protein PV07_12593 [Cladophialophora immunda]|uniref:Uncharacterized protein n=1 Tax=Cladophialophora immunda TaxID=569365 RepID=A0A0D2BSM0_9EURO|nr:uncharacterized protein PV07_12593 [Cladophialophora immunda]KIW22008.1 hypothetical protein PV07_12593 [Cladophialophora immunda]